MRFLSLVAFVLLASPVGASEIHWADYVLPATTYLSWADYQVTGCTCSLGSPCICGPNCDCASCGYRVAYFQAIEQHKPLVVGIGVTPPLGEGWISATATEGIVPLAKTGQTVLVKPQASFAIIHRFNGQVDPFAITQALNPPQQPTYSGGYWPPQPWTYGMSGGGCANGSCSIGGPMAGGCANGSCGIGASVGGGLRMIMGFGGSRCGPGGCR